MGMGKLGEVARVALAQCGSVLAYGSISTPTLEGQPSLEQLRAAFQILHIR
jgi:3-dehydroquinate dehydratase